MLEGYQKFKETYIAECLECGKCLDKCNAYHATKFPIYKHLKDFFIHQAKVKEIKKFLAACLYCKYHEHACVRGLDLSMWLPAIKHDLHTINSSYTWVPQYIPSFLGKILGSPRLYYFWRYLNNLLIPSEFRMQYENYRTPQKREVVFFSGCGIQLLENQYYILLETFKRLGIDFGLIDGSYRKNICCGTIHFEVGNSEHGLALLNNLLNEVKKFGTKKVVVYCATCYYGLTKLAPELIEDFDLEIVHASGYLAEFLGNMANPPLTMPEGKKQVLTIHDSCHLAHAGDTTSIRKLISLLPGAHISEMRHNKENSYCDLYHVLIALKNPLTLMMRNDVIPIIDEAVDSGADTLCSLCPGCHALLTIFGSDFLTILGKKDRRIPVKNWVTILGEYLGIKRRDMLTHRFSHVISFPFKASGLWYLWQVFKAIVYGYFGKRLPKLKR